MSIGEASHPGSPKRFARRDSAAVPSRQRSRSRCDTFLSSEEEPLVPSSRNSVACTRSSVPGSTGAFLDAGVESQFSRNVAPRVHERSRDIESGVLARCSQSPSHTDTVGGASAEVAIPSPQRRLVDAHEFDLTRCDSSEDGVSSRVRRSDRTRFGARCPATWSTIPVVQAVDRLFSELAARIGSVPQGADAPARLRRQRWSSVNVPLMWESPPVLDSLMGMASRWISSDTAREPHLRPGTRGTSQRGLSF